MVIALIIAIIALQIGQWLYSKRCIDKLKLIAQEWRETAEAYKDEISNNKIKPVAKEPTAFNLDASKQARPKTN